MKKLTLFITVLAVMLCSFCLFGCQKAPEPDNTPVVKSDVYLSQTQLTLTKGETVTVSALSDKKIDTLSLKWKNSDTKIVNFSKDGADIIIRAIKAGNAEITLSMSGKVVDSVKITVLDPVLSVRLPQGTIVLSKGQSATVTAVTTLNGDDEPVWTVECQYITLESQGMIARITVSDDCPNGLYNATVKKGDAVCKFTVTVGK